MGDGPLDIHTVEDGRIISELVLGAVARVISRTTGETTQVSAVQFHFNQDKSKVTKYVQVNRPTLASMAAAARKLMTGWEKNDKAAWLSVVSEGLVMEIRDPAAGTFSFAGASECWTLRETRPPEYSENEHRVEECREGKGGRGAEDAVVLLAVQRSVSYATGKTVRLGGE